MKKTSCKESHKASCEKKKDVIAYRKKCKASGTGLSHYILEKK